MRRPLTETAHMHKRRTLLEKLLVAYYGKGLSDALVCIDSVHDAKNKCSDAENDAYDLTKDGDHVDCTCNYPADEEPEPLICIEAAVFGFLVGNIGDEEQDGDKQLEYSSEQNRGLVLLNIAGIKLFDHYG